MGSRTYFLDFRKTLSPVLCDSLPQGIQVQKFKLDKLENALKSVRPREMHDEVVVQK